MILVTGGAGFIGKYVVENLQKNGYEPLVFDRTGKGDTQIFLGDTTDFSAVNEAVAISDGVIHLAGVLGTAETVGEPRPSIDANIYGSLNVFQACRNYKKKCVYITVGNWWMNNSYSITKDTAARFAYMFNKEHGTEIAVVRGLNAYGAGQKHTPVRKIIPNFILPALRDDEITVYGDGTQIMDMIYVEDLADVLVKALVVDHNIYDTSFEAGTGIRTSVQEIAESVIRLVGKGRIKNVPMRAGETEHSVVIGKPETLKPLYGNIPPFYSLDEGLEMTIPYYRELL